MSFLTEQNIELIGRPLHSLDFAHNDFSQARVTSSNETVLNL